MSAGPADGDAGPSIIVSTAPDDATAGAIMAADGAGGWPATATAGAGDVMARLGLIGGGWRRSGRAGEEPSSAALPDVVAVPDRRTILGSGGGGIRGGGMGRMPLTLADAPAALTLQPLAAPDGPLGVQVFRAACPCQFMRNKFNRTTKVFHLAHKSTNQFCCLEDVFFWFVLLLLVGFGGIFRIVWCKNAEFVSV